MSRQPSVEGHQLSIGQMIKSRLSNFKIAFSFNNARTWLLLILSIALVGSIYLGQGSQAAVIGQRVHDKQDRLEWTLRENDQLRTEITVLSAPDRIEARAKQLGFHPVASAQVNYAPVKDYPAQPTPATSLQVGRPPLPATDRGFDFSASWDGLLSRFGLTGSRAEATSQ
jgi:cell division protein FtsL